MMQHGTLEVVDSINIQNTVKLRWSPYGRYFSVWGEHPVDNIYRDYVSNKERPCPCYYTKLPSGKYYKVSSDTTAINEVMWERQLYELIQSGLEPYRAFEVIEL